MDEEEKQVGFLFSMPFGETLEIRSSKYVEEHVESDEEVDGIVYRIYWNGIALPWSTNTLLKATAIAFGCQYGARKSIERFERWIIKN